MGANNAIIPSVNWTYGNPRFAEEQKRRYGYNEDSQKRKHFGWAQNLKDLFRQGYQSIDNFADRMVGPGQVGYSFTGKNGNPAGLKFGGKQLGGWATGINAGLQGLQAANNLGELSDNKRSLEDLLGKIQISASSNPLLNQFLTSDQLSLLNKIKQGNYDASPDLGDAASGLVSGLPNVAKGALMGLPGGLPGVLVGGIGAAINSGLEGMNNVNGQASSELEALYRALQDAEMQYRSMQRIPLNGLNIQQRYQNIYQ